MKLFNYSHKS